MIASTQWIKKNMLGNYSEDFGNSLTQAKMRVKRCIEQLSIPNWYLKYSSPLKSKTMRSKGTSSPKKTPKKKSPKNVDKKLQEDTRTKSAYNSYNETYRIKRKLPEKDKDLSISITPSSSDLEVDFTEDISDESYNRPFNSTHNPHSTSYTFPRVTPSRKIQNINIVFPKSFPEHSEQPRTPDASSTSSKLTSSTPKAGDSMTLPNNGQCTRNFVDPFDSFQISEENNNDSTFILSDIMEPSKIPPRSSPSPCTRFFNSTSKSIELEKLVKSRRADAENSRRNRIREIIGELNRSVASSQNRSFCSNEPSSRGFVRNMVSTLERNQRLAAELEEDQRSDAGTIDSDLAKSTSISFKTYASSSSDESTLATRTPSSQLCCASNEESEEERKEEVYWVSCKPRHLQRTSSRLSVTSSALGGSRDLGRCSVAELSSPGLSPIRKEKRAEDWLRRQHLLQLQQTKSWGLTYSSRGRDTASRQLFRIDETGVIDSGYSDRSGAASSRAAMRNSNVENRRKPSAMLLSSPILEKFDCENLTTSRLLTTSGPYVLKSFLV